jgi:hypothetical protein
MIVDDRHEGRSRRTTGGMFRAMINVARTRAVCTMSSRGRVSVIPAGFRQTLVALPRGTRRHSRTALSYDPSVEGHLEYSILV